MKVVCIDNMKRGKLRIGDDSYLPLTINKIYDAEYIDIESDDSLGISIKNEGNMYEHYPKIFKQFGVKDKWELKEIINRIKTREHKLEEIGI